MLPPVPLALPSSSHPLPNPRQEWQLPYSTPKILPHYINECANVLQMLYKHHISIMTGSAVVAGIKNIYLYYYCTASYKALQASVVHALGFPLVFQFLWTTSECLIIHPLKYIEDDWSG